MTGEQEQSSGDQPGALEQYAAGMLQADSEAEEQFVEQMMAATMPMPPQLVLAVMMIAILCPPERRDEAAAQIAEALYGPRSDRSRT